MKRDFEFDGSGFGYLWLCIWTTVLSVALHMDNRADRYYLRFVLSVGIQRAAALDLQQYLR